MTCVMTGADREPSRLSAAEEQPPRELAEGARAGRLKLPGEGSLLGPMAEMAPEPKSLVPGSRARVLPYPGECA